MNSLLMIAGAGSGLGCELALRWAREGWQLALAHINEAALGQTWALVCEAGRDGFTWRCDARDYSQLTALAKACQERFGDADVIINNAGVASGGFFDKVSLGGWQLPINLMGVVKGCKAFFPQMQQSRGCIINIGSMAALMQGPAMSN